MPMPFTYRHASAEFAAYLTLARDLLDIETDTMAYTATRAVFLVFRARATPQDVLRLGDVLPAVLRAILVAEWHLGPLRPWGTRAEQTAEAQTYHPHHNLTPPNCLDAVAEAVAAQVLALDWDACLARLQPEAAAFWHVPPDRRHPVRFA